MIFWKKKPDQNTVVPAQTEPEAVFQASTPSIQMKSFWIRFRLLIIIVGAVLIAAILWLLIPKQENMPINENLSIIVETPVSYVSESIILVTEGHTKAEVSAYTKEIDYGTDLPIYEVGDEITLSDKKNKYRSATGLPLPKAKIMIGAVEIDKFEAKQSAIQETLTASTDEVAFKPYKNTMAKEAQVIGLKLDQSKLDTIFTKQTESHGFYYFINSSKTTLNETMAKAIFNAAQVEKVNKLFTIVQDQFQTITFGSCIDFGPLDTDTRTQYCFETNTDFGIAVQVDIMAYLERK